MKYRLLTDEDLIEATDEGLLDDCQTWEPASTAARWFIGVRYNRNFFVPMRRPIP